MHSSNHSFTLYFYLCSSSRNAVSSLWQIAYHKRKQSRDGLACMLLITIPSHVLFRIGEAGKWIAIISTFPCSQGSICGSSFIHTRDLKEENNQCVAQWHLILLGQLWWKIWGKRYGHDRNEIFPPTFLQ